MKKLIEIPDDIFNVLEQHKILTGRSTTSIIQEAIYRFMVHEKLITIKTVTIKREKQIAKPKKKIKNNPPQEILYCESESCEVGQFEEPIKIIKEIKKNIKRGK